MMNIKLLLPIMLLATNAIYGVVNMLPDVRWPTNPKNYGNTSPPVVYRNPLLYLAPRSAGFTTAIEAVLKRLQESDQDDDVSPVLARVVGVDLAEQPAVHRPGRGGAQHSFAERRDGQQRQRHPDGSAGQRDRGVADGDQRGDPSRPGSRVPQREHPTQ